MTSIDNRKDTHSLGNGRRAYEPKTIVTIFLVLIINN